MYKRQTLISLSFCCFVSLFYLACNKSEDPIITPQLNETFELKFNGIAEIEDAKIKVTFVDVDDIRCPTDMVCFWEGTIKVDLKVEIDGTEHAIELFDEEGNPQKAQVTIEETTIRLVSIEPSKLTLDDIPKDEYVITLIIE